jgi:hypothetical protein
MPPSYNQLVTVENRTPRAKSSTSKIFSKQTRLHFKVLSVRFQDILYTLTSLLHRHARPLLPTLKRVTTQRYVQCVLYSTKWRARSPLGLQRYPIICTTSIVINRLCGTSAAKFRRTAKTHIAQATDQLCDTLSIDLIHSGSLGRTYNTYS